MTDQSLRAQIALRCLETGNPCGTDTRPKGQWCQCAPCRAADHLALLEQRPIHLNEVQERAAKEWAADDRLWTTQETVEFNLRTFARVILEALVEPPHQERREETTIMDTEQMLRGAVGQYLRALHDADHDDVKEARGRLATAACIWADTHALPAPPVTGEGAEEKHDEKDLGSSGSPQSPVTDTEAL